MPADNLASLLATATARLKAAGSDTPTLDARLLLQAATALTREDLILGPDLRLTPEQQSVFEGLLARREHHEPVSRILGSREFYGRDFKVTSATLDPRPDTETIIDAALKVMPQGARLLDLGTGTGAIAPSQCKAVTPMTIPVQTTAGNNSTVFIGCVGYAITMSSCGCGRALPKEGTRARVTLTHTPRAPRCTTAPAKSGSPELRVSRLPSASTKVSART